MEQPAVGTTGTTHSLASGGGTGGACTGTPPTPTIHTTATTLADRQAATLAEGQRVQGLLLAADRAGDTAALHHWHDELNRLTKEYLRLCREEDE